MAEVTHFVAVPLFAADDGIAAGEPTECFNPTAVVMRAEALSRKPVMSAAWPSAGQAIPPVATSAMHGYQQIRRRAGRSKYVVEAHMMPEDEEAERTFFAILIKLQNCSNAATLARAPGCEQSTAPRFFSAARARLDISVFPIGDGLNRVRPHRAMKYASGKIID